MRASNLYVNLSHAWPPKHGFYAHAPYCTAAAATATPEMLKLAKKMKLQPAWLLDPASPALMESNAALDTEKNRLQVMRAYQNCR